jgi:hypothetical protein
VVRAVASRRGWSHQPIMPAGARIMAYILTIALVAMTGSALGAAAAPAGRLAFAGSDGIYVITPGNPTPHRIWQAPPGSDVTAPVWSPDGSRLAFAAPDGNIWTLMADGVAAHAITDQAVAPSGCWDDVCSAAGSYTDSPHWSPDGAQISYRLVENLARGSIWIVAAGGGTPARVAAADDLCIFDEGWSPAGTPLFSRCAADQSRSNATYTAVRDAQPRPFVAGSQIAYSPDGTRLAFSNHALGDQGVTVGLFIASAAGEGAELVADSGQDPSWSVGGLLAYEVGGPGGWVTHVYDPDTNEDHSVALGRLGGWTPDGGWLYYTFTADAGATIWRVRADGSDAVKVADGNLPDWGP